MKKKILLIPVIVLTAASLWMLVNKEENLSFKGKNLTILHEEDEEEEGVNMEQENAKRRAEYEWLISRDPKTEPGNWRC
jgi:hypothetical protein